MIQALLIALGGALGALGRYGIGLFAMSVMPVSGFPWGTLAVNIAGSFLIGVVWGGFGEDPWFVGWGQGLMVVGFLGAFTTFSAFSNETLLLINGHRPGLAAAYVLTSIAGGLLAAWLGWMTGSVNG